MSRDVGDGARLRRIESGLVRDDPSFVARFRSWPSPDGPPPGWTVVPPWAVVAFLVGLTTWMLTPVLGAIVVLTTAFWWLWKRLEARATAGRREGGSSRRR